MAEMDNLRQEFTDRVLGANSLSQEDALNVLKYGIVRNIDGSWGDGLKHLTKIIILHKAFPEDNLLKLIHDYLVKRLDEYTQDKDVKYFAESALRDQPSIYVKDATGQYKYIFDVNNIELLEAIKKKHPDFAKIADDVFWW